MKKTVIYLIAFLVLSCATSSTTEVPNENFDWLVGNWVKLPLEGKNKTFENWKKVNDNRFLGHGFIMNESDTVWQEKIELSKLDTSWVMDVETPGNDDLVNFKLAQCDSNSFEVENPKHDFPKKIRYWIKDDKLNALVTGGDRKLNYQFERVKL